MSPTTIRILGAILAALQFVNVNVATTAIGTQHPLLLVVIGAVCMGLSFLLHETGIRAPSPTQSEQAMLKKTAQEADGLGGK